MKHGNLIRPVPLWRWLAHHRRLAKLLACGGCALMLAASFALTGGTTGTWAFGLVGLVCLTASLTRLWPLWRHDLPLLREGVPVLARVVAPVNQQGKQSLYQISYRLPTERAERNGVFAAARDARFAMGEPLLVMVNRQDPGQLLEITGQYEDLMHPVLEREYA